MRKCSECWCPMTRLYDTGYSQRAPAANRFSTNKKFDEPLGACIGFRCGWWRPFNNVEKLGNCGGAPNSGTMFDDKAE